LDRGHANIRARLADRGVSRETRGFSSLGGVPSRHFGSGLRYPFAEELAHLFLCVMAPLGEITLALLDEGEKGGVFLGRGANGRGGELFHRHAPGGCDTSDKGSRFGIEVDGDGL
jgi:hypothetical protein